MYNPEAIQRDYVAYIEQQALDPFNTIYGANNLVAPPGILNFQFSLFFDRQTENANGSMPRGVLEDYDYFDLVIPVTLLSCLALNYLFKAVPSVHQFSIRSLITK